MAEELQMVEGSPDYELESQNGYLTEFNMTLLQICHISNSSILNQLQNFTEVDLIEACTNRPILPPIFGTFVQIFYALVCLVGLCGNTLVIYVVLRYSKMQTVTYIYILMLAIADEIFLFGIPFLVVTMARGYWIFGFNMCKIYYTTTSINQFTSSIFLTVLSADRYIAVCHPISAPKFRTPVIARCVSLSAWAVSALLMMPVFMYAATLSKPDGTTTCNIFWPSDDPGNGTRMDDDYVPPAVRGQQIFTIYTFILGFAIPLFLILIFYAQVVFKLRTVGPKSNSAQVNGKTKSNRKKSHAKVTRLVLTVITVYIFCWFPYWITQLALIFANPQNEDDATIVVAVNLLVGCLSYSNSAVNPVLYAFLSENFKKSFMKACTCANRGEANAALQVEHSLFPRKRTLLGRARGHHTDRNALRNKYLATQAGKEAKNGPRGHHHEPGYQMPGQTSGTNNADMIHVANDENYDANDVSAGVSMSRTSRSCFNSTNGPTGTTTVPPSANVSIAQPSNLETIGDEKGAQNIRVINGNLAPPNQNRRFNRTSSPPQTPSFD